MTLNSQRTRFLHDKLKWAINIKKIKVPYLRTLFNLLELPSPFAELQSTRRNLEFLKSEFGGNVVTKKVIRRSKKSNTLFILGSGSSINKLTKKQFDFISQNDSIATLSMIKHKFIADFYSIEVITQENRDQDVLQEEIISKLIAKDQYYKKSFFIIRPKVSSIRSSLNLQELIIAKFNGVWDFPKSIISISKFEFKTTLKLLDKFRIFSSDKSFLDFNSTIIWCIFLAIKLQYRHIVLCGIDLEGPYFYEESANKMMNRNIHSSLKKSYKNKFDLLESIEIINNTLLKKKGIRLYTDLGSKKLTKFLPIYEYI